MAITKPNMNRIWANGAPSGNIEDPDVTTPGKFSAGWLAEIPPFENFNFLQQLFTQSAAYNNEQGINGWDALTVYPVYAIVKGSNGVLYKAVLEQAGNDPTTDLGTNWGLLFAPAATDVVGALVDFAGPASALPTGYLINDASEVSKITFSDLFDVIGTTWDTTGGVAAPAAGNFRLPPSDIGGFGLYKRSLGGIMPPGTYMADMTKSHVHTLANLGNATGGANPGLRASTTSDLIPSGTTFPETRPRSISVLSIIKY